MQLSASARLHISRAAVTACVLLTVSAIVLLTASACFAGSNQFVILSDLHPSGAGDPQLTQLLEQIFAIRPAFIVFLGDDLAREGVFETLKRIRQGGIEVHAAFGNHDPISKRRLFTYQDLPLNSQLDISKNPEIFKRFRVERKYYYSFNWCGIHFVILDSTDGIHNPELRHEAQVEWMEDDLCRHRNNPSQFPALIFLHHPEWMTGDRNCTSRPVYSVLAEFPEHTVKAVFGGHWHTGRNFPPEKNLGVQAYATQVSIISEWHTTEHGEFVVATVQPNQIVFEKVLSCGGKGRTNITYHPIPGRFTIPQ